MLILLLASPRNRTSSKDSYSSSTSEPYTPANSSSADPEIGRFYSTYEDFVKARSRIAWKAPSNDLSVPKTPAQMSAVVDLVIAAIRNNVGCVGQVTKSFVNRWSTGATFYKAEDIEMVAWDVVVSYSIS
jgi:hypothetical protein